MSFASAVSSQDNRGWNSRTNLSDASADASQFGIKRYFSRNESIFVDGTSATHVYRVLSGVVRICRYTPSSQRFVVDFVFPSELVGFTNRPHHSYDAEAVGDCVLAAYPRAQFDALLAATPSVAAGVLSQMIDLSRNAQQHSLSIGFQDARQKVAAFLIRMADRNGVEENEMLYLPMKRRDIADHLALCAETTCRALSALKKGDFLSTPDIHNVVIKDIAALRALAGLDAGAVSHA